MRINLIFDNDEAGRRAKIKLAHELQARGHKNVWVYNFKGISQKDFNQMKVAGVDFELDSRLIHWELKTEILYRTGAII